MEGNEISDFETTACEIRAMSHPPGFATEPPTVVETGYTWKNIAMTFQGFFFSY